MSPWGGPMAMPYVQLQLHAFQAILMAALIKEDAGFFWKEEERRET